MHEEALKVVGQLCEGIVLEDGVQPLEEGCDAISCFKICHGEIFKLHPKHVLSAQPSH